MKLETIITSKVHSQSSYRLLTHTHTQTRCSQVSINVV